MYKSFVVTKKRYPRWVIYKETHFNVIKSQMLYRANQIGEFCLLFITIETKFCLQVSKVLSL